MGRLFITCLFNTSMKVAQQLNFRLFSVFRMNYYWMCVTFVVEIVCATVGAATADCNAATGVAVWIVVDAVAGVVADASAGATATGLTPSATSTAATTEATFVSTACATTGDTTGDTIGDTTGDTIASPTGAATTVGTVTYLLANSDPQMSYGQLNIGDRTNIVSISSIEHNGASRHQSIFTSAWLRKNKTFVPPISGTHLYWTAAKFDAYGTSWLDWNLWWWFSWL